MTRMIQYKGFVLTQHDDHFTANIGGIVHTRRTYDEMRNHLDVISRLAAQPFDPVIFPVSGKRVPPRAHAFFDEFVRELMGEEAAAAIQKDGPRQFAVKVAYDGLQPPQIVGVIVT